MPDAQIPREPSTRLDGQVSQISFDFGVEFTILNRASIRIEGSFTLRRPDEAPLNSKADNTTEIAAAIVGFLHDDVVVETDGATLSIRDDAGRAIVVPPAKKFEAWTMTGDGRVLVAPLVDGRASSDLACDVRRVL